MDEKNSLTQVSKTITSDGSDSFQTTYLDNSNQNVNNQRVISFGDLEKGDTSAPPNFKKGRRLSSNSLFTINEKSEPSVVVPALFKTISHTVSEINETSTKVNQSEAAQKFINITFHSDDIDEVASDFNTSLETGLSSSGVDQNSKTYGLNVQSKPPSGLLRRIFLYFFGGFGGLLSVSGILCIVCWKPLGNPNPAIANLALGVILLVIFFFQAFFNFIQDFSASNVMKSINNLIPLESLVIRDGQLSTVDSKHLVPGDLIVFNTGDKVPADVRIIENSNDLAFDRSILTGESLSVPCSFKSDPLHSNYLESTCIAMQGTFITSGSGRGIVVATGDDTIFGSIAKLTAKPKTELSPLQWEIVKFVLLVSSIIFVLGVLIIILYFAWLKKAYPGWIVTSSLIIDLVSVAVSFIPEGLPVALTTCLLITSNKMRKNKILCKSLSVVETLGAVSVLCFDKTGTITKNDMIVTNVCCGDKPLDLQEASEKENSNDLYHMLTVATLCNDTSVSSDGSLNGNATDKSVYRFVENIKPRFEFAKRWNSIFEIAFNSKDKYMAKVLEPYDSDDLKIWSDMGLNGLDDPVQLNSDDMLLTIKGAPDILMERCEYVLQPHGMGSKKVKLTSELKAKIKAIQMEWSTQGKRVILMASKVVDKEKISFDGNPIDTINSIRETISEGGLMLAGLVGIEDPPRKNIDKVINTLRNAGIKIIMITGDFELTGLSIAKQVGIVSTSSLIDTAKTLDNPSIDDYDFDRAVSITGKDLNYLTEPQWEKLVKYKELVFTRTTPEQKLLIIKQFQSYGAVIGMTGDGINDSPSLKQADIGISLINASDIAKEAADVILMNDDGEDGLFNSIIEALNAGRLVFENLKKTVSYVLPAGTFAELWCVLLNVIFGMPQMLSSFNMVIISCVTDCLAAVVLAYEPSEKNLLLKKPRTVTGEKLVDKNLLIHSYAILGIYDTFVSMLLSFLNLTRNGYSFNDFSLSYGTYSSLPNVSEHLAVSSSIYFANLVIMQVFNLLSVRTRYLSIFEQNPWTCNRVIFLVIVFNIGFTFVINYIPAIQSALGTGDIPVEYYFISLGFGSVILIYDELRKLYVKKNPQSFIARLSW